MHVCMYIVCNDNKMLTQVLSKKVSSAICLNCTSCYQQLVRQPSTLHALENRYIFQPTAVETLGPINDSAVSFLSGFRRPIADVSGETRKSSFLFQRLYDVLI